MMDGDGSGVRDDRHRWEWGQRRWMEMVVGSEIIDGDGSGMRDDRALIVRTTVCHVLSAIDRQGRAWSGLHDDSIEEVMDDDGIEEVMGDDDCAAAADNDIMMMIVMIMIVIMMMIVMIKLLYESAPILYVPR